MRVVVSGATGLIGSALAAHLRARGHDVVRLVRRDPGAGDIEWDPATGRLPSDALDGAGAVVHLAGAGIGDHRWTERYRHEILDSRVRSTELLAAAIAAQEGDKPVLVSGSAVGYYGASDDRELDESSPSGTGFLAEVCRQWEQATRAAGEAGARVVHVRTGVVLTPKGGALKKLLPLFKLGVGGRFGSGRQWQSWIALDDEVAAITHLLTADVEGPANLTAPNPVTNAEFTTALARTLHRAAVIPVPRFAPALVLGGELADALLFTGQRVFPRVLEQSGYEFIHPTLEGALQQMLDR